MYDQDVRYNVVIIPVFLRKNLKKKRFFHFGGHLNNIFGIE